MAAIQLFKAPKTALGGSKMQGQKTQVLLRSRHSQYFEYHLALELKVGGIIGRQVLLTSNKMLKPKGEKCEQQRNKPGAEATLQDVSQKMNCKLNKYFIHIK